MLSWPKFTQQCPRAAMSFNTSSFSFPEKTLENYRVPCNRDVFFPLKVRMTSVAFSQLSHTSERQSENDIHCTAGIASTRISHKDPSVACLWESCDTRHA